MKTLQQNLISYFVPAARSTSAASRASAASRKVKALLTQHPSIKVEKDRQGGYWITCSIWENEPASDPLRGEQFATSWEKALDCVNVYVTAIEALPA